LNAEIHAWVQSWKNTWVSIVAKWRSDVFHLLTVRFLYAKVTRVFVTLFFETPFHINSPSKFHGKYCILLVYFIKAY
jgi:hypothetical protein